MFAEALRALEKLPTQCLFDEVVDAVRQAVTRAVATDPSYRYPERWLDADALLRACRHLKIVDVLTSEAGSLARVHPDRARAVRELMAWRDRSTEVEQVAQRECQRNLERLTKIASVMRDINEPWSLSGAKGLDEVRASLEAITATAQAELAAWKERAERRKVFILGLDCGGSAPGRCPDCRFSNAGEETDDCRRQRALADEPLKEEG